MQAGCILGLATSSEIFTFKLNNEDHMEVFPLRYVIGIRKLTSMRTSKLTEMKTDLLISEPENTLTSCELHVHHHPTVHISLNVICLCHMQHMTYAAISIGGTEFAYLL